MVVEVDSGGTDVVVGGGGEVVVVDARGTVEEEVVGVAVAPATVVDGDSPATAVEATGGGAVTGSSSGEAVPGSVPSDGGDTSEEVVVDPTGDRADRIGFGDRVRSPATNVTAPNAMAVAKRVARAQTRTRLQRVMRDIVRRPTLAGHQAHPKKTLTALRWAPTATTLGTLPPWQPSS